MSAIGSRPAYVIVGPVDDERSRVRVGRVRDDRARMAGDRRRVEAAGAAVDDAGDAAARRDHEGVLVARGAGEVLEAGEGDAGHRAGARAGDRPGRVGRRAVERVRARAAVQRDGHRQGARGHVEGVVARAAGDGEARHGRDGAARRDAVDRDDESVGGDGDGDGVRSVGQRRRPTRRAAKGRCRESLRDPAAAWSRPSDRCRRSRPEPTSSSSLPRRPSGRCSFLLPPPEPEPVPATGDEPFCDCDAGSPDASPADGEVPDDLRRRRGGAGDAARADGGRLFGVFTWRDGDDGSGTETVDSAGSSCGAGPEPIAVPEPVEIVPEPPELIVCCDESSEPGAAGGSCGVVPSESPCGALQRAGRGRRRLLLASGAAGAVLAGGVAAAGAVVEAMLTGAPAVSVTAGVLANRSTGVVVGAIDEGASEYESLTTGMRVLMLLLPTWSAGRRRRDDGGCVQLRDCELGERDVGNAQRRERRDGRDRPGRRRPQGDCERTDVDRRKARDTRRSEPEPRTPLPQPNQAEGVGRSNVSRS